MSTQCGVIPRWNLHNNVIRCATCTSQPARTAQHLSGPAICTASLTPSLQRARSILVHTCPVSIIHCLFLCRFIPLVSVSRLSSSAAPPIPGLVRNNLSSTQRTIDPCLHVSRRRCTNHESTAVRSEAPPIYTTVCAPKAVLLPLSRHSSRGTRF